MIKKLRQSQWVKDEKEFWLLSLSRKTEKFLFYLLIILLPTQFGKHFWPSFSYVLGQRVDYLSPTLYVTDILLIFLFFIVFFKRKISIHPLFSLLLLFLGINIFLSITPASGWYEFLKFLEVSFLAWYVSKNGINKKAGVLLATGVLLEVFLALGQMVLQHSLGGAFYFLGERTFSATTPGVANASISGQLFLRPYATFSHPNIFAGYVAVVSLILLYIFQKEKSVAVKAFIVSSLVVGAIGIALSLSRVVIVLSCFVLLFVIKKIFGNFLKRIAVSFISLGCILLFSSIFFPEFLLRFLPPSFGESITDRIMLANSSVTMFRAHPFLGIGLGNFLPSLPLVSVGDTILQPVHNIYLLIASELGLVGITIFISFLWHIGKKLFLMNKKNKQQKASLSFLLLGLLAILFSGMFDHYWITAQQGQLLFGLVVGLCFYESNAIDRDTIQE